MKNANILLRTLLGLIGLIICIMGFDVILGGIRTLGWFGPNDFLEVTNVSDFKIQDNHFRFLGGIWLGVGFAFLIGAIAFSKMQTPLIMLCGIIFVGGIGRLGSADFDILISNSILPALALELFAFPLIAIWISKTGQGITRDETVLNTI